MFDYVEIIKHIPYNKDAINRGYLQAMAVYNTGWESYQLKGCRNLEVWINNSLSILKIKGSIPYFFQGHNFTCNKTIFVEAIKYIGRLLNCDLWDAQVEIFEFGMIIAVENKPKDYILRHQADKGLETHRNPKNKGDFVLFRDKFIDLKMYDAGKNIKQKQTVEMKQIIQEAGWNPQLNYLKWEVRYKKPHLFLNKGVGIKLADLVSSKWELILNGDLLSQYKRLNPMKTLLPPMDKKNCSSADIILLELAETRINAGYSLDEIKKSLYSRVNALDMLSEDDKKARKRQIKNLFDRLMVSKESIWDFFTLLKDRIFHSDI